MPRTDRVVSRCVLCLLASAWAMAQNMPTISVTTRLVQVNVIASDKNGPIEGLTKDDFTLYDNGKKQRIAFFETHSRRAALQAAHTSEPLAPNEYTNRPGGSAEPDNVVLIVWDMLNTGFADQVAGRQAVLKSLKIIRPGDRIGIYILNSKVSLLQDFTSDSKQIADTLEKYAKWPDPMRGDIASGLLETVAVSMMREERTQQASWEIMHHLAHVSGRKSLVWISATAPRGVPYSSDVNLYYVDPRGLPGFPAYRAENREVNLNDLFIFNPDSGRARPPIRYTNNNDIRGVIDRAIADGDVTYTLGFYLDSGKIDPTLRHELKVQTRRKGATLRYKKNYIPIAYAPPVATRINNAIVSAIDSKEIAVNAKLEKEAGNWRIQVSVGAADVFFTSNGGRRIGSLNLVIAQRSADGSELERVGKILRLDMDDAHYADFLKAGSLGGINVVSKPGLAEIKVVVLDQANGNLGSLAIPTGM